MIKQFYMAHRWSVSGSYSLGHSGPGNNCNKGGARGVILIVVGNGLGDTSSNPGPD